ncbi:MAG: hypothetical protein M0Q92_14505 [Methanoregula sp.]|nr:hypothetical protein [Methanoregula sp.]
MGYTITRGIVICDRYRSCAGASTCGRLHNREAAFERFRQNGETTY